MSTTAATNLSYNKVLGLHQQLKKQGIVTTGDHQQQLRQEQDRSQHQHQHQHQHQQRLKRQQQQSGFAPSFKFHGYFLKQVFQ